MDPHLRSGQLPPNLMIRALFLLLLVLGSLVFLQLAKVGKKEIEEYEQLLLVSNQKKESQSLSFLSQQWRKNIVKEVWKGTLYMRMEYPASELVAIKGGGKYDAIEKMGKMRCLLQEKLCFERPDKSLVNSAEPGARPVQEVRYFEAERGFCSYGKLDFVGEVVTMKKYRLQGHSVPPFSFPNIPCLSKGVGQKVHFCLKDKVIDVRLDSFETSFNPKEGI